MDKHAQLRQIVATLSRVEPDAVGPDFSLAALLAGSLTVHRLEAAVREHLGAAPPRLHGLRTYAELEAAVLGQTGAPPTAAARPRPESPKGHGLACGLDVEPISNFPAAT